MFWKSKVAKEKEKFGKAVAEVQLVAPLIAKNWSHFSEKLVFKPEVSLEERVMIFSTPTSEWVRKSHPDVARYPFTYMSALLLGIWLAGTNSREDVEQLAEDIEHKLKISQLSDSVKFWTRKSN